MFPALDHTEAATHKLGEPRGHSVLLSSSLAISIESFGSGRTKTLTGLVHLVVLAVFLLLIAVP